MSGANGRPHRALQATDILASFFAKVAEEVGTGRMGNVSRAVVYIRSEDQAGPRHQAVVITYPIQSDAEAIAELESALMWCRQPVGTPAPSGVPS